MKRYNPSTFMPPKTYPYAMLAVLTGLNMLNYIDRNVLFAVQPLIKKEFQVSDYQIGILTSAFFICYMVAAPLVGWLGDRFPRKYIMIFGIAVWSGFTFLSWLVRDYNQLLFRHTIVGIGEASYATIAPTLIADSFPIEKRGRMLSIFYTGLPAGSALGYIVGGYFSHHYGWRAPFMVAGAPGFLLALALWFLPEPERGQSEHHALGNFKEGILGLWKNGAFVTASLGMAAYTFAVGGMQVWLPTFLERVRHLPLDKANAVFGLIMLFNGFVATLIGGWLGDRLLKKYFGAYYTFPGIAMLVAVPFMVLAIYVRGPLLFPCMFAAGFFLLIGTGPTNAALVNSVSAGIRSTALAVNVFVIHLLGDAFSPSLIGKISDHTSLQTAFWAAFVAAGLSGIFLIYGARYAPRFQEITTSVASR
jgi:MFS family permease